MARVTDEMLVCVDCLVFVANGELPDSHTRAADILAGVLSWEGRQLVAGDSENDHTFSRQSCDLCGDWHHGSRHEVVVLQ